MKIFTFIPLVAAVLVCPVTSFAQQTTAPITRAEVRADLIRVEQAGYNPASGDDVYYPADVQAAEAKVAAEQARKMSNDAVGAPANGTSAAGKRVSTPRDSSPSCVGPASFCDIYYGE